LRSRVSNTVNTARIRPRQFGKRENRGIRGLVVDCADCGEQHFHEWNLLRASLQQLLDEGHMRRHEPAFDPDPTHYVTWEYCRGYADAVFSSG